jgi:hypothetical protein
MIAGTGNSHNAVNVSNGEGYLIQYNQIISCGEKVEIRNNYIKNVGYLIDDFASIYF